MYYMIQIEIEERKIGHPSFRVDQDYKYGPTMGKSMVQAGNNGNFSKRFGLDYINGYIDLSAK